MRSRIAANTAAATGRNSEFEVPNAEREFNLEATKPGMLSKQMRNSEFGVRNRKRNRKPETVNRSQK
jgi:hypothetical protein